MRNVILEHSPSHQVSALLTIIWSNCRFPFSPRNSFEPTFPIPIPIGIPTVKIRIRYLSSWGINHRFVSLHRLDFYLFVEYATIDSREPKSIGFEDGKISDARSWCDGIEFIVQTQNFLNTDHLKEKYLLKTIHWMEVGISPYLFVRLVFQLWLGGRVHLTNKIITLCENMKTDWGMSRCNKKNIF